MVTAPHSLSESYSATCDVVPVIRHAIADFAKAAGVKRGQLDVVRLAVTEAVPNAVVHAYRGRGGCVHVSAHVVGDELCALVADDGCGPHTPPQTPGLGFGLAVITDACEQVTLVGARAAGPARGCASGPPAAALRRSRPRVASFSDFPGGASLLDYQIALPCAATSSTDGSI